MKSESALCSRNSESGRSLETGGSQEDFTERTGQEQSTEAGGAALPPAAPKKLTSVSLKPRPPLGSRKQQRVGVGVSF